MKRSNLYYLLLAGLVLTGCKSPKLLQSTNTGSEQSRSKRELNPELLAAPLFETAEVSKMTATVELFGRTTTVNMRMAMHSDSALWLSVLPMFNIEMFRVELAASGVGIFDKMNRRYARTTVHDLAGRLGLKVSYADIERLISARLFAMGSPDYFTNGKHKVKVEQRPDYYRITFTENKIHHQFDFSTDGNYMMQSAVLSRQGSSTNEQIIVKYENPQLQDGVLFPRRIHMRFASGEFFTECVFDILEVTFNQPIDLSQQDTRRYRRVSLQTLMSK